MKYLGLAYVVFSWAWGYYLLRKHFIKEAWSVSYIAASSKVAYLLFAVGLSISALTFLIFSFTYLADRYNLTLIIKSMVVVIALSQLFLAWVNGLKGALYYMHNIASSIMSASTLMFIVLMALGGGLSGLAGNIVLLLTIFMIAAMVGLVTNARKRNSTFILLQNLFIGSFHAAFLAISYL